LLAYLLLLLLQSRAIPDGLDHGLDFSVQLFSILPVKVCLGRVNNEFHVFAIGFQDRVRLQIQRCCRVVAARSAPKRRQGRQQSAGEFRFLGEASRGIATATVLLLWWVRRDYARLRPLKLVRFRIILDILSFELFLEASSLRPHLSDIKLPCFYLHLLDINHW